MKWTGEINVHNVTYWKTQARAQRERYYKDGSNEWGDDHYDEVDDAIKEWLLDNAPDDDYLEEVGADYDGDEWQVVDHEYPMGSLDKVKETDEYKQWAKKNTDVCVMQEKLDGISVSITYDSGKLTRAVTRKTGTKGEDITRNVLKMKGVPSSISYSGHVVLRGEILLYHSDFKAVNQVRAKNDDQEYKNPRNAAAGMAKDQKGTYCSYLTVQIYDVMNMREMGFVNEAIALDFITKHGFIPVTNHVVLDPVAASIRYQMYVEDLRAKLNWDIDGLVVKTMLWEDPGSNWKKPKNKIAWKFPPQRAQTTVKYIYASPASRITPVAVLEPVECGGVTIQRASLANWPLALEKKVGPGAIVEISRRNDVIPYVESVLKAGDKPELPDKCPACGSPTEWELTTSGEESVYLVCSSIDCPIKLAKLIHKWLNVHEAKGVGTAFVDKIIEEKMVTSLVDFLNFPYMTKHQNTLMTMDGFGKRKMKTINDEIEKTLTTTVPKLFSGLNFQGIGSTRIEAVADEIDDLTVESFIDYVLSPAVDQVIGDGLGPSLRKSVKANRDLIDKVANIVTISKKTNPQALSDKLEGLSFCFTGKLDTFGRTEAEKVVKSHGGTCSGVSKKLSYLVTNDPDSNSGKAKKARELGIKIITEEEFLEMVEVEAKKDETVLFGLDDFLKEPEEEKRTTPPPDVLFSIDDL
jgi:DNA ligase (NAD+)